MLMLQEMANTRETEKEGGRERVLDLPLAFAFWLSGFSLIAYSVSCESLATCYLPLTTLLLTTLPLDLWRWCNCRLRFAKWEMHVEWFCYPGERI